LFLASLGIGFQVFVLYPWHEELSAEFKDLEAAIIRLDKDISTVAPGVEVVELERETDKYATDPEARSAGPKISSVFPFVMSVQEKH
jgi:hypothetical protein